MNKRPGSVRNRVFGAIGVLWGGAVIISRLVQGTPAATNNAYAAGSSAAGVFGALLLVVGLYYLIRG